MKSIILIACFAVVTLARATTVQYNLGGVFVLSQVPTSIANGDTFSLTFDMDTDAVDVSGGAQNGIFWNAISNLTFSLNPGSTGNYGGGTMTASQFLHLTEYSQDAVHFYASSNFLPVGLDFASADSIPFLEFGMNFNSDDLGTFSLGGGLGQTLGSVLPILDLADFSYASVNLIFGTRDQSGNWVDPQVAIANITSITTPSVPDYPSPALMLIAGGFMSLLIACRKRILS